ncbi:MAG: metallophosphoesterase [Bacteroidia bacterium]|nr:metallophosphoesterase [Bacteroidia bacterium]
MKNRIKTLCLWLLSFGTLCISSCDVIDIHPYDGRIEVGTNHNEKNIREIEKRCSDRETIRFAVISDTHSFYDEFEDEVADINSRQDIDFVIDCGDMVNYGMTHEFEWHHNIAKKIRVPYVAVIGNHDCIGHGRDIYRHVYGRENFSFVAGGVRFVCMDTNALEYDFSCPVPDLDYLDSWRGDTTSHSSVVVMHAVPYSDEFDNNVAKVFQYEVKSLNNALFCLAGHDHRNAECDIFGDGLMYYKVTCGKYRQYYIFTIGKEGYSYETISY